MCHSGVIMENRTFSDSEKKLLLTLARDAILSKIHKRHNYEIDETELPDTLRKKHATFVTLTKRGSLRGCIGTLEAYQSLVKDIYEHAIAAAFDDYRFPPVKESELDQLTIEISVLSEPKELIYKNADDLVKKIRPGIDGVIIINGTRRATFLPQVWEQLPDPNEFLSHLCLKMGATADYWRNIQLKVSTYQVDKFSEQECEK